MDQHHLNKNFLSIDTEGGEFDIIASIDLERFQFDVITVENPYGYKRFATFLASKGNCCEIRFL